MTARRESTITAMGMLGVSCKKFIFAIPMLILPSLVIKFIWTDNNWADHIGTISSTLFCSWSFWFSRRIINQAEIRDKESTEPGYLGIFWSRCQDCKIQAKSTSTFWPKDYTHSWALCASCNEIRYLTYHYLGAVDSENNE